MPVWCIRGYGWRRRSLAGLVIGQIINARIDGVHNTIRHFLGGHKLRRWMILMNALIDPVLVIDTVLFPCGSVPVEHNRAVDDRLNTRLFSCVSSQSLKNVDGNEGESLVVGPGVRGNRLGQTSSRLKTLLSVRMGYQILCYPLSSLDLTSLAARDQQTLHKLVPNGDS